MEDWKIIKLSQFPLCAWACSNKLLCSNHWFIKSRFCIGLSTFLLKSLSFGSEEEPPGVEVVGLSHGLTLYLKHLSKHWGRCSRGCTGRGHSRTTHALSDHCDYKTGVPGEGGLLAKAVGVYPASRLHPILPQSGRAFDSSMELCLRNLARTQIHISWLPISAQPQTSRVPYLDPVPQFPKM